MTSPITRLLHLGNVVVDVVLTVSALPEPGGDVLATGSQTAAGGGFNVMAAAARLGLPVAYGGVIGSGPFAAVAVAACAAEGIEVLQPAKPGLDTGFVISVVDATGERTFLTSRGAEATLTGADLGPVRPVPGDAVYLSGYGLAHPSNAAALRGWLARLGDDYVVVFDPGPLAGALADGVLHPVLDRADWVTCNARESALLTGAADPREAARGLAGQLPRAGVLVRVGPAGCLLSVHGSAPEHVPGFGVEAVDTNGAGDTHAGAFLAVLASGARPAEAVRQANAAAALSVTRRGPATGPTRAELAAFLASRGDGRRGDLPGPWSGFSVSLPPAGPASPSALPPSGPASFSALPPLRSGLSSALTRLSVAPALCPAPGAPDHRNSAPDDRGDMRIRPCRLHLFAIYDAFCRCRKGL
jgi:sugar/nucleoside kinase (ribokinase family)